MTSSAVTVHVADHSFGLFDHYEIPVETADWSNGLVVVMSSGAIIYTGIDRGNVRVTVDLRTDAPEAIDEGPWDDIVEASVFSPHGRLRVECLEYGPDDMAPPLPLLSTNGPGHYRVRAHVRGRDLYYDKVPEEPAEDYMLTIWPAEPSPATIIRATDQRGYGLRLTSSPEPPVPEPPPARLAEQQRRAFLHQAIVKGME